MNKNKDIEILIESQDKNVLEKVFLNSREVSQNPNTHINVRAGLM